MKLCDICHATHPEIVLSIVEPTRHPQGFDLCYACATHIRTYIRNTISEEEAERKKGQETSLRDESFRNGWNKYPISITIWFANLDEVTRELNKHRISHTVPHIHYGKEGPPSNLSIQIEIWGVLPDSVIPYLIAQNSS